MYQYICDFDCPKSFKSQLCSSTFVTGLLTALTRMTRTQGTYIGVEETTKMTISLNIMIVRFLESNLPTIITITIYNNDNWLEDIYEHSMTDIFAPKG